MSLVRKDVKLGMFAGAALLVLGAGYVTVLSLFGGDNDQINLALQDPLDAISGAGDPASPEVDINTALPGEMGGSVIDVDPGDATPNDSLANYGAASGRYDVRDDEAETGTDDWGGMAEPIVTNPFDPAGATPAAGIASDFGKASVGTGMDDGNAEIIQDIAGEPVAPPAGGEFGEDYSKLAGQELAGGQTTETPAGTIGNSAGEIAGDDTGWDSVPQSAGQTTPASNGGTSTVTPNRSITGEQLPTKHALQSGESYSTLSEKYYGTSKHFSYIQRANPQLDPTRLQIGQMINIPTKPIEAETTSAAQGSSIEPGANTYTVTSGDTLSRIAQKQLGRAVLWEKIFELNRDVLDNDPQALKVGMVLRMPG